MADPKWDNNSKTWNVDRPFHRIGSKAFDSGRARVSGRGYDSPCKCRKPGSGLDRLLAMIPNWAAVPGEGQKEVEGELAESFQSWTDTPMFQWHEWYDWNFHIWPSFGYEYLRSKGNEDGDFECEWDTGAFGKPQGQDSGPGPMFAGEDWAWPMKGQYIWLAGRWIYDCGHASNDLMRSELHPCKAIATARWEAVRFDQNSTLLWPGNTGTKPSSTTPFMPAIQFMFFASRKGGYANFRSLEAPGGGSYRFIVDLPNVTSQVTADVEHTPGHACISVPQPNLLWKFEFEQFKNHARGKFEDNFDPVKPLVTAGAGDPPEQVTIEIPVDKLDPATDTYGVIISIGWWDSAEKLAERVAICNVTFDQIKIERAPVSIGRVPHWDVRFGTNGRWFRTVLPPPSPARTYDLKVPVPEFALPLDHPTSVGSPLMINTHGAAINLVGEFMEKSESDRLLHAAWGLVSFQRDAVDGSATTATDVRDAIALQLKGTFNVVQWDREENIRLANLDALLLPSHDVTWNLTLSTSSPPNPLYNYTLLYTVKFRLQKKRP